MKLLKIEGVEKEIVIEACNAWCPLNRGNVRCGIDANVNVMKHSSKEKFPSNCPLPEYVNENEHTAPDGTELVAVQNIDGKCNCDICYYQTIQDGFERCTRTLTESKCCACDRKDKRNIGWALKKNKLEVK